jgi:hypothetical protein
MEDFAYPSATCHGMSGTARSSNGVRAVPLNRIAPDMRCYYAANVTPSDVNNERASTKSLVASHLSRQSSPLHSHCPLAVLRARVPEEIAYLKGAPATHGKSFDVVFIDNNEQIRFERLQARMRPARRANQRFACQVHPKKIFLFLSTPNHPYISAIPSR